ncbi:MAG: hypothetical protein D6719_12715 [Candidatus Dadabacteria bacterium]|nr:MAG: hypothetical protein D6719_12715 [Candidatus Dadabacteria bacterium]
MTKKKAPHSLEEHLLRAMRLIDNQIAREMQRTPEERETEGVLKWTPYKKRSELLTSVILNAVGENSVKLDSLLVLLDSSAKALELLMSDLGSSGLGSVRSAYCQETIRAVQESMRRALQNIDDQRQLM